MPYFDVTGQHQLNYTPHLPITRTILAPRLMTPLGAGVTQIRRRYPRPLYQFTLRDTQSTKASAEELFGLVTYLQADRPFFWSGGEWGTLVNFPAALVAGGDGVTTQHFLPNRHITANLAVYLNNITMVPQPTLDGASGLLTFATPPLGVLTATYTCIYRVTFWNNDGETLLTEQNIARGLFSQEGLTLREFLI